MIPLHIFLADDHSVVRTGLKALIDGQPDMQVVGEASDGIEVLAHAAECQPDVVVIDLSMPRLNGVEATRRLVERDPQVRILVLSVHEDAGYLRQALEAGAAGYVLKRSAAESLIEAIRQVAAGEVYLDPALGNLLVHSLVGKERRAPTSADTLSEREAVVLHLIAQGYSNKEIAYQLDLSVKTIETYKARGMEKLGISSRVEIVRYASEHGWLRQP